MRKVTMLQGLTALKPKPEAVKPKRAYVPRKVSLEMRDEHHQKMLSTIVKMLVDGYKNHEVVAATRATKSFVHETKRLFGLLRPSLDEKVEEVRKLLKEAPDYTYRVCTLSDKIGVSKTTMQSILRRVPEITKGTEVGNKHMIKYDETFSVNKNSSRGTVLR